MSNPSKNIPMPIRNMMRRWKGPIGSRSRRLPAFTDVDMCSLPFFVCSLLRPAVFSERFAACCLLVQSSLVRRVAIPVERLVVRRDHHALGVEMVVKAFGAAFAADAGIIDAAPGRGRIKAVMIVDPDDAGLDGRRHAMGAADVAGADRGCEPER